MEWPESVRPAPAALLPSSSALCRVQARDEEEGGMGGERRCGGPHTSLIQRPAPPPPRWISGDVLQGVRLHLSKAHCASSSSQSTLSFLENVFPEKARSVFPAEDLFVMISLQIGPWQKNPYNFLLATPFEVNPTPTSSFHRARSVGIIFIMFQHSENDHFALSPNQPPPRANPFR